MTMFDEIKVPEKSQQSEQNEATGEPEKQLASVENLADEHDYWLSLTDAARVTRTSEAMVRRWVSSGRLPVKQEPVGINQRTRLVRASDVSRLRPIVDPTAAITDHLHKLDLLSIPRQQVHIAQEQGRLLTLVQEVQQLIRHLVEETRTGREQQETRWTEQFQSHYQELQHAREQHEALATLVHEQARESEQRDQERQAQLARNADDLQHLRLTCLNQFDLAHQELAHLTQEYESRSAQIQQEWTELLRQQESQSQQLYQALAETLSQQEQNYFQAQEQLLLLQRTFSDQQQTFASRFEEQRREVTLAIEQHHVQVQQEQAALDARLMQLEQRWEQQRQWEEQATRREDVVRCQIQEQSQKMDTLEHQVQQITTQLQQEAEQRVALEAHVALLREHQQPR